MSATPPIHLALVLSGGGARAAYQVGVLRAVARRLPAFEPPILTGVSAGAINCAWLASRVAPFADKIESLARMWHGLSPERIFRVDSVSLARNVLRTGLRLVSGGLVKPRRTLALVDTSPLRELLQRDMAGPDGRLLGVQENLAEGRLRAVAMIGSSYSTGQSITWVEGRNAPMWERAHRRSVATALTIDHVMASAALPLFFPAVKVDGSWFGDGGIRLTAPLSPAIHLGADRLLAISTRYARNHQEAAAPVINGYPPPAQVAGVLLNAIFLDVLDADALATQRVNRLIRDLPEEARRGLRPVELLVVRPSRDLGRLANDYEARLPGAFRFLTRGLGTKETRSNDLLSLLMFQADYLSRLLEIGEEDGTARIDEIVEFLAGAPAREALA